LRDYVRGAYEALNWVQNLIRKHGEKPDLVEILAKEVSGAIDDINEGVAIDFRDRLKTAYY